jgi:hypothetical protein
MERKLGHMEFLSGVCNFSCFKCLCMMFGILLRVL